MTRHRRNQAVADEVVGEVEAVVVVGRLCLLMLHTTVGATCEICFHFDWRYHRRLVVHAVSNFGKELGQIQSFFLQHLFAHPRCFYSLCFIGQ